MRQFTVLVPDVRTGRNLAYPPMDGEHAMRLMERFSARRGVDDTIARTSANDITEYLTLDDMRAIYNWEPS